MIWDLAGASAHSPLWLTLSLSEPAMVVMRPVTEDDAGTVQKMDSTAVEPQAPKDNLKRIPILFKGCNVRA